MRLVAVQQPPFVLQMCMLTLVMKHITAAASANLCTLVCQTFLIEAATSAWCVQAVKEMQAMLRETQYKFGNSSLSLSMSQADKAKLAKIIDSKRAQAPKPAYLGPSLATQAQMARRRYRRP